MPSRTSAKRAIPATVLLLGVVSLLNDVASDMIYPVLPMFLATILGAGPVALGLIEGFSEATASLLKVLSGIRSDATRRRVPLILAGYAASNLVRPLIGLATAWPQVLGLRFADRVGKGLRTSPRDALIADITAEDSRGGAYALQRGMDNAGAVVGPLITAALIAWFSWELRSIFLLTAIPAALTVAALLLGLREPPRTDAAPPVPEQQGWQTLGVPYKRFLLALVLFTLGGSTDAFLILRMHELGIGVAGVSLLWAAHHAIKVGAIPLGGSLTDRWGARPTLTLGWLIYAAVYLAFALVESREWLVAVFLLYSVYYSFTEPAERAWVSLLVPRDLRGTAFGYFHGVIGLTALPASVVFGFLMERLGAPVAFLSGSCLAATASLLLLRVPVRAA